MSNNVVWAVLSSIRRPQRKKIHMKDNKYGYIFFLFIDHLFRQMLCDSVKALGRAVNYLFDDIRRLIKDRHIYILSTNKTRIIIFYVGGISKSRCKPPKRKITDNKSKKWYFWFTFIFAYALLYILVRTIYYGHSQFNN